MGITTKQYFENIYSVIFTPIKFYNEEEHKISVRQAMGTVIFISLFFHICNTLIENSIFSSIVFSLLFLWKLIASLLIWFFTGLFFEYVSKIFSDVSKLGEILFYTAFATVPMIFFAPLQLLKEKGDMFYSIGTLVQFLLYFWIIFLYVLSLKKVYNISIARAFMFLSLPFIGIFYAITWGISFFSKIGYINAM